MNRKETTEKLRELLIAKTSNPGVYDAKEVSLDWGTINVKYVDYMTFKPQSTLSVSGVEKGIFTCYEIKSCYEDLYSGKGLNFIGEKNYIVTTMEVYKRIIEDQNNDINSGISNPAHGKLATHIKIVNPESKHTIGYDVGIMVAIPKGKSEVEEFDTPTPFGTAKDWTLTTIQKCRETPRKRSLTELLFCLMKAR